MIKVDKEDALNRTIAEMEKKYKTGISAWLRREKIAGVRVSYAPEIVNIKQLTREMNELYTKYRQEE